MYIFSQALRESLRDCTQTLREWNTWERAVLVRNSAGAGLRKQSRTGLYFVLDFTGLFSVKNVFKIGVDRLSAPILSILPIIDIGHFKNRFADNFFFLMQTNILFKGDIIYW